MAQLNSPETTSVIPQDIDAERGIIGSVLMNGELISKVSDLLNPSDFYYIDNQKIFDLMLKMEEDSVFIDLISMNSEIKKHKLNIEVSYLSECLSGTLSSSNIALYARIVKEKKILREIIATSNEVMSMASDSSESIEELVDKAEQRFFSIAKQSSVKKIKKIKELLGGSLEKIKLLRDGKIDTGEMTGISQLDEMLAGLHKSDLIVIGARPSVGKSALAITIAHNISVKYNKPVALFSLEMSNEQVVERMLAINSNIPLWKIRTGRLVDDSELETIKGSVDVLGEAGIFIDDSPSPTIMEIRRTCRRIRAEHKDLALIIVDYLQLIKPRKEDSNIVSQITEISRGLKIIAKELNVPVIALSQLSRNVEQRDSTRPKLSDLRDSGSIEQDADIVILLQRIDRYDTPGLIELIIAKHRNGPIGSIEVRFNQDTVGFENVDKSKEICYNNTVSSNLETN